MKDKKGFLLAEETLKIIIAVICIGFLAFLLFSIYQQTTDSKNLDYAKSSLNFIVSQISSGQTTADIYNPDGWVLDIWPQTVNGILPSSCSNLGWKSCICICNQNTKDSCDSGSSGVCLENTGNFNIAGGKIDLKNLPIILKIDQTKKEISINGP